MKPSYCPFSGKQSFPSVGEATKALRRLRNKAYPYICPKCTAFHISQKGTFEARLNKNNRHSNISKTAKEDINVRDED